MGTGGPGWEVGAHIACQGRELGAKEVFLRAVAQILPSWGSQTQRQKRQGAAEGKRNRGRDRKIIGEEEVESEGGHLRCTERQRERRTQWREKPLHI